ncbi:DELTA-sagatoxin-Srs1a-like [Melanotaenia boesemani]|uniref:DELTA-sagatoxin-Srs1a-like n=1 Tax=Melanotaenia boesemani TaxID=1250792 RepID=UPI001C058DD0|nr:DELTA-sagatoxin-Srs1a-like [Melanotaenia boesemani]XP_041861019.1 DELTA-sagatoxin-Srs1a-like [Melanotaenia boesemani]
MPHRHCSIEISNNSNGYTLANPRVFIESGYCEVPLPPMVGPCSVIKALFNKTTGTATGAVGVFTYDLFNADLNDYNHTIAVMFSVPYDRILFSNWCAVGIFKKGQNCNYSLYNLMYNRNENNFVRAKADGSSISYEGDYVIVSASMSDGGEAVLRVDISDTGIY